MLGQGLLLQGYGVALENTVVLQKNSGSDSHGQETFLAAMQRANA